QRTPAEGQTDKQKGSDESPDETSDTPQEAVEVNLVNDDIAVTSLETTASLTWEQPENTSDVAGFLIYISTTNNINSAQSAETNGVVYGKTGKNDRELIAANTTAYTLTN